MADSSEGEEEGKLTGGGQQLVVDDDLREMGKKAAWSVSSYKPGNGVLSLRDDNLDTFWQSDGAQPHLVNVQFQKKVKLQVKRMTLSCIYWFGAFSGCELILHTCFVANHLKPKLHGLFTFSAAPVSDSPKIYYFWQIRHAPADTFEESDQHGVKLLVVLYVDFKIDESYTPGKISIRAGDGFHNLKEVKAVELVKPTGWMHISLSGNDPRETFVNTFMLQIAVLSNHLNGRDTHIRQIKVFGPRPNPIPLQPFQFTSSEFITYSVVR